ncbi:hypothetical protein GBA52_011603 [Prunus armeniaca]|nr:hypothetical protein GBA52_011603 [Prunus armeniaca]
MGHRSHSVSLILSVMLMAMSTELPITSHCMMMNKSSTPLINWANNSLVEFEFDRDLLNDNINGAEGESDLGLAVVMHMVDSEETSRRLLAGHLFSISMAALDGSHPVCSIPRVPYDYCLAQKNIRTRNFCRGADPFRRDCKR